VEIFYTLAVTLKYAKALGANKQSKTCTLLQMQKLAWMEIFGSKRRHAWGKEDVWESYTTTTTTTTNVAPAPIQLL